jgi:hypothetical protein
VNRWKDNQRQLLLDEEFQVPGMVVRLQAGFFTVNCGEEMITCQLRVV